MEEWNFCLLEGYINIVFVVLFNGILFVLMSLTSCALYLHLQTCGMLEVNLTQVLVLEPLLSMITIKTLA